MSDVETLRLAASALITAVEEHLAAVTEGTDPSAERETLLRALESYQDAVTSKTQTPPEPPEESDGGVLSILTRTDHHVEDFGQLVEAGRAAYRTIRPDAGEDEVRAEVPDVSRALYEILHVNDDQPPLPFPAAKPITGLIWFLSTREAMPTGLHDSLEDPFGVAGEADESLLYAHRHLYAETWRNGPPPP
ncbi:hypothetical protein ACWDA3_56220 [Nonomuraea rubra]